MATGRFLTCWQQSLVMICRCGRARAEQCYAVLYINNLQMAFTMRPTLAFCDGLERAPHLARCLAKHTNSMPCRVAYQAQGKVEDLQGDGEVSHVGDVKGTRFGARVVHDRPKADASGRRDCVP